MNTTFAILIYMIGLFSLFAFNYIENIPVKILFALISLFTIGIPTVRYWINKFDSLK